MDRMCLMGCVITRQCLSTGRTALSPATESNPSSVTGPAHDFFNQINASRAQGERDGGEKNGGEGEWRKGKVRGNPRADKERGLVAG